MHRFLALLMVFVLLTGLLVGCTPAQQLENPTTKTNAPTTQQPTKPTGSIQPPTTDPTGAPDPTNPTNPTDPTDPPEPPTPEEDFSIFSHSPESRLGSLVP